MGLDMIVYTDLKKARKLSGEDDDFSKALDEGLIAFPAPDPDEYPDDYDKYLYDGLDANYAYSFKSHEGSIIGPYLYLPTFFNHLARFAGYKAKKMSEIENEKWDLRYHLPDDVNAPFFYIFQVMHSGTTVGQVACQKISSQLERFQAKADQYRDSDFRITYNQLRGAFKTAAEKNGVVMFG